MRVTAAGLAAALVPSLAAPAAAQLGAAAQKAYADYQMRAPHRAFFVAANGEAHFWSGATGVDPAAAVERGLKFCEDKTKAKCSLYAVNNVVVTGRDWKVAAPTLLPTIGRLRPEPYWQNQGPQAAAGLIVWSHGYMTGVDSTASPPQGEVVNFTNQGYDLYRFDRQYIRDWPGDASQLVEAVKQARAMGYRRVILAGQSAGGWVSLAATLRGAPVDGVIAVSPAHHGEVKDMRDISKARTEWQQIVGGIKPGPRVIVVIFKDDTYDVGGRTDDAAAGFKASGVESIIIGYPEGFVGHGAAGTAAFPRKFGACIHAFIEQCARQPPCRQP